MMADSNISDHTNCTDTENLQQKPNLPLIFNISGCFLFNFDTKKSPRHHKNGLMGLKFCMNLCSNCTDGQKLNRAQVN